MNFPGFAPFDLLAISLIFLVGGIVKGGVGLGLPSISIALMALWLPLEQAMGILILPVVITNIWQAFYGSALLLIVRRLWVLLIGLFVGAIISASFAISSDSTAAVALLGLVCIIYAGLNLSGIRFTVSVKKETTLNPIIGIFTGLITGATAFFVIPAVPYLQSLDFGKSVLGLKNRKTKGTAAKNEKMVKDALIQSFALTVLVGTGGMTLGMGVRGAIPISIIILGTYTTLIAIVGMIIGRAIRNKLSLEVFRHLISITLLGLGSLMVFRYIF